MPTADVPLQCSARNLLLMLVTAVLTISGCTTDPVSTTPPVDNRPIPDPCAMLGRSLAPLGKFRVPDSPGKYGGFEDACHAEEPCRAADDDCANPETRVTRWVVLTVLGREFDHPNFSQGHEVRKTTVNGRQSVFWAQQTDVADSWNCTIMMRISKLKSLSIVAHAKRSEQACTLGKAVAKSVEPELPPELAGHVPG